MWLEWILGVILCGVAILPAVPAIWRLYRWIQYRRTVYFKQTRTPYGQLRRDKGKWGEYLIYKELEKVAGYKRFLFNCYVPTTRGRTTEIDIIFFHERGIFVVESKNYAGEIWGTEGAMEWLQVLPGDQGYPFFNPLRQNDTHIRWLRTYLSLPKLPVYSLVVFGNGCSLEQIEVTRPQTYIVTCRRVKKTVRAIVAGRGGQTFSPSEIEAWYERLYPRTQVDGAVKEQHIRDIREFLALKKKDSL